MVADCSACTLTMSLPALMKSATLCSGSTIILHSTMRRSEQNAQGEDSVLISTC